MINKKTRLLIILIAMSQLCFGKKVNISKDTTVYRYKPLYIIYIANKPPVITANYFMNPRLQDFAQPLTPAQSVEICKLFKVDYVFIVKISADVKTLTLSDVLRLYKIPTKYLRCPVKVDDRQLDYPETLVISKTQIEAIKIMQDKGGYFIDILLTGYSELKKKYPHGGEFKPDP